MRYFLKNPQGIIEQRDINTRQLFELRREGYTRLSGAERIAIAQEEIKSAVEKKAERKRLAKEQGLLDVYFLSSTNIAHDGYSASALLLKKDIEKYGVFLNDDFEGQEIGITYHIPPTMEKMPCKKSILFSMFESTRYPENWGRWWKSATKCITPSKFCTDVLETQFDLKADTVQLGYEPEKFYLLDRPRNDQSPFTFLHFDAFKWRKGWDIVLNAFDQEFGKDENVRLIFKTTVDKTLNLAEYKNIEVIKEIYTLDDLRSLMARSDCFVFPSRGEGFGLTPLEAMATGMPIIVPDHTGMSEYFETSLMKSLEWDYIVPKYDGKAYIGMDLGLQFQPTIASVRKAMRAEYEIFKQGAAMRKVRARNLAEHAKAFQCDKTARELEKIIKSMQGDGKKI